MSTFTETRVLQSLEIFPALNVINVKHLATTLKDGVKFVEQTEAKSYSTSQFSDFKIEVAPMGGTLAEIVAGFSAAALDAAAEIPATLAAKEAEKTTLEATNTAALAAKDSELTAATSAHESEVAALEAAHEAALAAKDATITTLQAQIDATAAVAAKALADAEAAAAPPRDVSPINAQQAQSLVLALGPTLGLTAGQLEVLFAEAEKLQTP